MSNSANETFTIPKDYRSTTAASTADAALEELRGFEEASIIGEVREEPA